MSYSIKATFDRKGQIQKKGFGSVEFYVRIDSSKKYILYKKDITLEQWNKLVNSKELLNEIKRYECLFTMMSLKGETISMDSFNKYLSLISNNGDIPAVTNETSKPKEKQKKIIKKTNVTKKRTSRKFEVYEFIRNEILKDDIRLGTRKHKETSLTALMEFGKFKTFSDFTIDNLTAYDKWLRKPKKIVTKTSAGIKEKIYTRTAPTVHNYHKDLKKWLRLAYENDLIETNPYKKFHYKRGECKEREPLAEEQLLAIRNVPLTGYLERARDLFIFAAYTGLAYSDTMNFNFDRMCRKIGERYFIDGSRIKTDSSFYTPILQPAIDILKKYNYKLPIMSNQKINDYMKIVAHSANVTSRVTFHVARHSFATMCISHGISFQDLAKMLGHKDIKVTQIYGKVMPKTIQNHTEALAASIL